MDRKKIEEKVFKALSKNDLRKACELTIKLIKNKSGKLPSFLNVDVDLRCQQLQVLFDSWPKNLNKISISDDLKERFKIAAAMQMLNNFSYQRFNVIPSINVSPFDSTHDIVSSLIKHVFYKTQLKNDMKMLSTGIKLKYKVLPCDDSCNQCKEFSKKAYTLEDHPEMPYEHCNSPFGCRCSYLQELT